MFKETIKAIKIIFKYSPRFALIRVSVLIGIISCTTLSLFCLQWLIDDMTSLLSGYGEIGKILKDCTYMLLTMFAGTVLGKYVDKMLQIRMKEQLSDKIMEDILYKFTVLPYSEFENPKMHDTLHMMSGKPDEMLFKLYNLSLQALQYIGQLIGTTLVVYQAGMYVAVSFILLFPVITWLNFKTADEMNGIYNLQSSEQRYMEYLENMLLEKESLYEIKIFGGIQYIFNKWEVIMNRLMKQRMRIKWKAHNYYLLGNMITFGWLVCNVIFISRKVLIGSITVGIFVAVFNAFGEALDDSEELYMSLQQLRWRVNIVKHFQQFMDIEEIKYGKKEASVDSDVETIVFDKVSFTYPGEKEPILKEISFCINKGEHIALVGENGAGKSTIIKLLCGLYEPDSGKISIGGKNISALTWTEKKEWFSVIFQDYIKLELSLRENIAIGKLNDLNNTEKLKKVIKITGVVAENGVDMSLGKLDDGGIDLSGGQWQRIAIARAYYTESKFVIMDEPTAALDPQAESEVYQNISTILERRGCILISHRMASAKMADKIIVIKNGYIVEEGNHQELMNKRGLYAQMYQAQSQWYQMT